jgi:hypothetical protein
MYLITCSGCEILISGSCNCDYENSYHVVVCNVMQFRESPTLLREISLPSPRLKSKPHKKKTLRNMPSFVFLLGLLFGPVTTQKAIGNRSSETSGLFLKVTQRPNS